ncbi:class I SAM-dependent rRNA methyltransferase [Myxococcota bacterium]|nr:class I SAM-dependent rRNA methyltransferase [Myxococcota bacterium]MBU1379357.1 class I SAM-dependent rRNA methyltransferase [Myxococcota bacterium]MBU1497039.1 class I SAM-dependent rRNA methyltransferase [Myxococcota bacterium]
MSNENRGKRDDYPIIIINKSAVKKLESGCPFVYRSDIIRIPQGISAGVVGMTEPAGKWVGMALYNPESVITLRYMTHRRRVDVAGLVTERFKTAWEFRRDVLGFQNESCRIVNGEADGIPGIVCDRIGNGVTIQSFSSSSDDLSPLITEAVLKYIQPDVVVLKNTSSSRGKENLPLYSRMVHGTDPLVNYSEGVIRYTVNLMDDQKTGTFLDQRFNHIMMGNLARGKSLDLFSYHGGFGLSMAKNASSVISVDSSQSAVDKIISNARENNIEIEAVRSDGFDYLRDCVKNQQIFSTVVCDPPALARKRTDIESALKAYHDLAVNCMKVTGSGGLILFCSCSSVVKKEMLLETISSASGVASKRVSLCGIYAAPADHPSIPFIPETNYLKCFLLRVIV